MVLDRLTDKQIETDKQRDRETESVLQRLNDRNKKRLEIKGYLEKREESKAKTLFATDEIVDFLVNRTLARGLHSQKRKSPSIPSQSNIEAADMSMP